MSKFNKDMSLKDMLKRAKAMMDYLDRSKKDLTVYTHKPLEDHECLLSITALESNLSDFQKHFSLRLEGAK